MGAVHREMARERQQQHNLCDFMKDVLSYLQHCGKVMIFIDAANIIYSLRSLGWKMDYRKLYQFFVDLCVCRGVYFYVSYRPNSPQDNRWLHILRRTGYIVRQRELKLIRRGDGHIEMKGNLDGYIFIDVLDRINDYDTCVLLSGDSDFEVLVDYLHKHGKKAVVCSARSHIAMNLRRKADRYVSLMYFKDLCQYKKPTPLFERERFDFSPKHIVGGSNPTPLFERERIESPRMNTGEVDDS